MQWLFALFTICGEADDGKAVSFFKEDGEEIISNTSFHSILAKEAHEFYTRYALYISAISLLILVFEKILRLMMMLLPR